MREKDHRPLHSGWPCPYERRSPIRRDSPRSPQPHRRTAALVSLFVTALLVGPFTLSDASAARCLFGDRGEWTVIPSPDFSSGSRAIVSFSVPAAQPDSLLATNGVSVALSNDRGCSWDEVFSLGCSPIWSAGYEGSSSSAHTAPISSIFDVPRRSSLISRARCRSSSAMVKPGSPCRVVRQEFLGSFLV